MDKSNANPDYVKQQLAEAGLIPDEWDGDTLVVPVSALHGEGVDDLLEAILLVADDTDIRANPKGKTAGTVIEAQLERSRGVMTTVIVQNGTLERGDTILAGTSYGRIKAMFNDAGDQVKKAPPSTPVRVKGLNAAPLPGTIFTVVKSEKVARQLAEERELEAESDVPQSRGMTLDELFARFQAGETKELNLIVKVDVQGSLETIINGLESISFEEEDSNIKVNILHSEIGNVSESDVSLASASGAIVVGFNVKVDSAAKRKANNEGVEIRLYNVIYKMFEDIEMALAGMLDPVFEYQPIGLAEVRQVFTIPRVGKIAGSYIRDGIARRDARARVIRRDRIIHEAGVSSLKRFQEDVREVRTGFECGINVEGFSDFEEGDLIQFLQRVRVR
ncbi:MAG: translation initiation factor IF-2 [Anaerolineae bacterium]